MQRTSYAARYFKIPRLFVGSALSGQGADRYSKLAQGSDEI